MKKTEDIKEYKRQYYQRNKERLHKLNKEWIKNNPAKAKEYQKNYRQKEKSKGLCRERNRKWTKNNQYKVKVRRELNKEKQKGYVKKSNEKYPKHIKARQLANYNIKITKEQICDECGSNLAEHKHHEDYSKPLEVQFLCNYCHSIKHRKVEIPLGV